VGRTLRSKPDELLTDPWIDAVNFVRRGSNVLAQRIVERLQTEMETYRRLPAQRVLDIIEGNIDVVLRLLADQRTELGPDEREFFVDGGRVRAEQNLPSEDVIRAWFVSSHEAFDYILSSSRSYGVTDSVLLSRLVPFQRVFELASAAFMEGHRAADINRWHDEERRRSSFVAALLKGSGSSNEVNQDADEWHLDLDIEYIAFRSHLHEPYSRRDIESELGLTSEVGMKRRGLAAVIDDDLCGFVASIPKAPLTFAIGFGVPTSLAQLSRSFRAATRALATGIAFGDRSNCQFEKLGLRPAVVADAEVSDVLIRRWIEPVLHDGRSGLTILATVGAYLSHGLRNDVTAAAEFIHHNTLRYRLDRFEQLSGADLRDTETLFEVWWALQAWGIRNTTP
jgi:PucR C-terminal helix-turn-helix domain